MLAATYIAKYLKAKGIKQVFGYDGSMMLKIADEISLMEGIGYVQGFHEQAVSFAADAYARVTGKPGVLLVTSGPGVVNALAGITDAYMDSVPLIAITGQDYSSHILTNPGVRLNGFQDLNVVEMAKPVTKYAVMITDVRRLAYELEKCFFLATDGRKGSVLIDIPMDIQFTEMPADIEHFILPQNGVEISSVILKKIMDVLVSAKRPLILAGGGVRLAGAEKLLAVFSEKYHIPVVTTLNGHDAYSKAIASTGLYGAPEANLALRHADVLFVLGARLGQQQVGKFPEKYTAAKIIHVDIDKAEFGRILPPYISVCADLCQFLNEVLRQQVQIDCNKWDSWWKQIAGWQERYAEDLFVNHDKIDPVRFVREIGNICPEGTIFTNDVGQNTMWVCQGLQLKFGQRLLTSSGYASMGFSLPAAIGARLADSSCNVIAFSGDGGFQMNLQELQFVKMHKLNIKFIVFNNNTLGMMREVQRLYYNDNYVGSNISAFTCVDLQKVAALYDLDYYCIFSGEDFDLIKKAVDSKNAAIIDCRLSIDTYLRNWNEFQQEHPEELVQDNEK